MQHVERAADSIERAQKAVDAATLEKADYDAQHLPEEVMGFLDTDGMSSRLSDFSAAEEAAAREKQRSVPDDRCLPAVLEQFFRRQDIFLLGFATGQDKALVRRLFNRSNRHGGQLHSQMVVDELNKQFSPVIDLAALFQSTTGKLSSAGDPVFSNTAPEPPKIVLPAHQVEGRAVGAVQATARVFRRRFVKDKMISVSNWAAGPSRLSVPQKLYAAKDALLPLLVYQELDMLREALDQNNISAAAQALFGKQNR